MLHQTRLLDATLWSALLFAGRTLAAPGLHRASVVERAEQIADEYDYVIVGAGTAGLTIADRLTEAGNYSVLTIEYGYVISDEVTLRGGGRSFSDPGIRYNITSTPQPEMNNRTQAVVIGACVGGSSAINGMVMMRGTSDEYDVWKELGGPNSTWDWAGVLPYFKKAIHYVPAKEALAKPFNITYDPNVWGNTSRIYATYPPWKDPAMIPMYEAMKRMPDVPVPLDGAAGDSGLFWFPTSMDPVTYWRSYARTGHFDNITRENFVVLQGHKVTKVLFDGTTATGVQFFRRGANDTLLTVKARKEVLLAAGAVHTPQVLQLSGIGPPELLKKAGIDIVVDLPGVGQNFQDHGYISATSFSLNGTIRGPNLTLTPDPNNQGGVNLGAWLGLPVFSPDNFEKIASSYESQDPAAYLPAGTHPTVIAGYAAFQKAHAKLLRSRNSNWLWVPINTRPGQGGVMSMHIVSHGSINIDPRNPHAEPIVDYRALTNPVDLDLMVENIKYMRRFAASDAFKQFAPVETSPGPDYQTDEQLRAFVRQNYIPTNYHPIATAAKMPQELGGVVDEDLFVHGTAKLRVVDASIMPALPGAQTQQSTYMIGEKAADMIMATW